MIIIIIITQFNCPSSTLLLLRHSPHASAEWPFNSVWSINLQFLLPHWMTREVCRYVLLTSKTRQVRSNATEWIVLHLSHSAGHQTVPNQVANDHTRGWLKGFTSIQLRLPGHTLWVDWSTSRESDLPLFYRNTFIRATQQPCRTINQLIEGERERCIGQEGLLQLVQAVVAAATRKRADWRTAQFVRLKWGCQWAIILLFNVPSREGQGCSSDGQNDEP